MGTPSSAQMPPDSVNRITSLQKTSPSARVLTRGISFGRSVSQTSISEESLSFNFDTLMEQLAVFYGESITEALSEMQLRAGRQARLLSFEEQRMIVSLAESLSHIQERKEDSEHFQVDVEEGETAQVQASLTELESEDSIQGSRFSSVTALEAESVIPRVKDSLEKLQEHAVFKVLNKRLVHSKPVIERLLHSVQAKPIIKKMMDDEELTTKETAALLAQADHLDAIKTRDPSISLNSLSSAEAAMPYSSEQVIDNPETVRYLLHGISDKAMEGSRDFLEELSEIRLEAQGVLPYARVVDMARQCDLELRVIPKKNKEIQAGRKKLAELNKQFQQLLDHYPQLRQYQKDFHVSSAKDVSELVDFLLEVMIEEREKSHNVSEKMTYAEQALDDWEETQSNVALGKVCQSIRELSETELNSHMKQTLELLADHLRDQVMTQVRAEFEASLRKQLKDLEKGGSERSISVSVGLGGALSAFGVKGAALDFSADYTFKVTGNDDTRIREFHVVSGTGKLSVGDDKVVAGYGSLTLGKSKGRAFRNLDDFVKFHANDIVPVLIGKAKHLPKSVKGAIQAQLQDAHHKKVVANSDQLTLKLQESGLLLPSQAVVVDPIYKPNYAELTVDKKAGKLGASALSEAIGVSLTMTNTVTNFRTRTDLLQTLKENPMHFRARKKSFISFWVPASDAELKQEITNVWIKENKAPKTTKYSDIPEDDREYFASQILGGENFKCNSDGTLQKRVKGPEAIDWVKSQQELLESGVDKATRLEVRRRCQQAIRDQYTERDLYYYTLNAMDGYISTKGNQKKRLADVEKKFP